ncbi:translation initiation factor IF-2 subunit beta [Salarchaeum japonicum]|uniref:translation initiation factor IF-2 subunit beta n=1 Tax=Salarchaeum japonicum TaxID=555573 RepID=UPI003C72C0BA
MDYEDQLDRAMSEKPDVAGSESRFDVPEPTVRKEGNVTVYENFQETIDQLGRDEDHVLKFIQDELATSAQIDESGRARFTGEFGTRRVKATLDDYVDTYVLCPECGLPDTNLETENGSERLHCEACGARSAV